MDTRENRMGAEGIATHKGDEGRAGILLRTVFFGMLQALWGYVLSAATLPFGAAPFGVALLAAADHRAVYVLGGACLWAIGSEERVIWLLVFGSVVGIRILTRLVLDLPARLRSKGRGKVRLGDVMPHFFREHIALRMATSAVAVFAVGLVRLRTGGYLFYDLYGTILSVFVAPVAVLLLGGFFEKDREGWRHQIGFLTLGTMLCYGAADWKFYGISLGIFGAMFAALYVSSRRGLVEGIVTGTLFGMALSPFLAPMFAFGALVGGIMFPYSVGLGSFLSFLASLGWSYYVVGFGILDGIFAALLSAHFLFSVWDKLFSRTAAEKEEAPTESEEAVSEVPSFSLEDRVRLNDSMERLQTLCRGFRELGDLFYKQARSRGHAEEADLRQICDRAFDACCTSCPTKDTCWGEKFRETSEMIGELSSVLHQKGRVEREDVDRELSDRCGRMHDILEEIHHNTARYEAELLAADRTEIFSEDFRMLSEMLASVMTDGGMEYEIDAAASEALCLALSEKGLEGCARIVGKRRRRVFIWDRDGERLCRERETVRLIAEECVGFSLDEVRWEDENRLLELLEKPNMIPRVARRTVCALGEEEFCGDTVKSFCTESGNFYALISDGMGSGREACATSQIAGVFLKKLLQAEGGCEESIRLLNVFLRNRGSGSLHECSATADLLALDLMKGRASFYKSGAAPTYVYREGGLFKLRSRTVPLGILREPDVKRIGLDMGVGDLIIMVSDGVTQGKEECPWLYDLLRSHAEHSDVERLADLVVKYAKDEGSTDDISVLVMRLEAA